MKRAFDKLKKLRKMFWSGRRDLNSGPPAPKAGALPGCATPRHEMLFHYRALRSFPSAESPARHGWAYLPISFPRGGRQQNGPGVVILLGVLSMAPRGG